MVGSSSLPKAHTSTLSASAPQRSRFLSDDPPLPSSPNLHLPHKRGYESYSEASSSTNTSINGDPDGIYLDTAYVGKGTSFRNTLFAPIATFPRNYSLALTRILFPVTFASLITLIVISGFRIWKDANEEAFIWEEILVDLGQTIISPVFWVYSACICFPRAFKNIRTIVIICTSFMTSFLLICFQIVLVSAGTRTLHSTPRNIIRSSWQCMGYLCGWWGIPYYFYKDESKYIVTHEEDGKPNMAPSVTAAARTSWTVNIFSGHQVTRIPRSRRELYEYAVSHFVNIETISIIVGVSGLIFLISVVFGYAQEEELLVGIIIIFFCFFTLYLDREKTFVCQSPSYLTIYICLSMTVLPAASVSLVHYIGTFDRFYAFLTYLVYSILMVLIHAVMMSVTRHASNGTTFHYLFMITQVFDDFCSILVYIHFAHSTTEFIGYLVFQMFRIFIRNTGASGFALHMFIQMPSPTVKTFNILILASQSLLSNMICLASILTGVIMEKYLDVDGSGWSCVMDLSDVNQILENYIVIFGCTLLTFYIVFVYLHRQWNEFGLEEEYGFWDVFL